MSSETTPATVIDGDVANLPAIIAKNDKFVRRSFWKKLHRVIARIPFVDDLVAAYFCSIDPKTPVKVRGVLLAALAYFIIPTDLLPDFIAGLGFTDDATVIATAMGVVSGHIKKRHRDQARTALGLPPVADDV